MDFKIGLRVSKLSFENNSLPKVSCCGGCVYILAVVVFIFVCLLFFLLLLIISVVYFKGSFRMTVYACALITSYIYVLCLA